MNNRLMVGEYQERVGSGLRVRTLVRAGCGCEPKHSGGFRWWECVDDADNTFKFNTTNEASIWFGNNC